MFEKALGMMLFFSTSSVIAQSSLEGRWSIEEWTYQGDTGPASYSGSLTILDIEGEGLVGELATRDAVGRARQKMRITTSGTSVIMRGEVVWFSGSGAFYPADLQFVYEGNKLIGRSMDSVGHEAQIMLRKTSVTGFPARCDSFAFFAAGRRGHLITEGEVRKEMDRHNLSASQMREEITAELDTKQAQLGQGRGFTASEAVTKQERKLADQHTNAEKLNRMLGCIDKPP